MGHPYRDLPLPDEDPEEVAARVMRVLRRMKKHEKYDIGGVITAVRVGNSLLVVIPARLVKKKRIKAGDRFIALGSDLGLFYRRILGQDKELTKLFGEAKE